MRLEGARKLPLCDQERIAAQILEKLAAAAPEILEKVREVKAAVDNGMITVG